jgi:hypothetical protein
VKQLPAMYIPTAALPAAIPIEDLDQMEGAVGIGLHDQGWLRCWLGRFR